MQVGIRTAIVGAGNVSSTHSKVLRRLDNVTVVAVVDRDLGRARSVASGLGVDAVFDDVGPLIDGKLCDVAHVLVPPDLHRSVGEALLRAGIHVFMEKPLATTDDDCAALISASTESSAQLGVNQNLVFNPTFLRLKSTVHSGQIGRLRHLMCVWNVPLVPLTEKRFGLWMFHEPQNIVLEQAVHPLSILLDLGGRVSDAMCLPSDPKELERGRAFHSTWQVSLRLEHASAQLFYSVGQTFRVERLLAICDDGVVEADLDSDRVIVGSRSVAQQPMSGLRQGWSASKSVLAQSLTSFADVTLKDLRLRQAGGQYLQSMESSVRGFYDGLSGGKPPLDGDFGRSVVAVCSELTRSVARTPPSSASRLVGSPVSTTPTDFVLLGGSGFIGQHLVSRLVRNGYACRLVTRNAALLPESLRSENVELVQGNVLLVDPETFMQGARFVVDLVLPDADDAFGAIVESGQRIAGACLKAGVERLVYLSSIVALSMSDPDESLVGTTCPIPNRTGRDPYARGKAECERLIRRMSVEQGLPVCILRPGIVVGAGGKPFHGGVGKFVNEQHCVGYSGENPMPFVLVEDMAEAIVSAAVRPEAVGKVYNVVGDVRLSAVEYIEELARVLERPLKYHRKSCRRDFAENILRWVVKRVVGRNDAFPSYQALRSLTFAAQFDSNDIKRDLDWTPTAERDEFILQAIKVHEDQY